MARFKNYDRLQTSCPPHSSSSADASLTSELNNFYAYFEAISSQQTKTAEAESKKTRPACLNDYRPVALTSVVMKCFERVKDYICSSLPRTLDTLQFACRPNHSMDDAIAHILHAALSHQDKKGSYVRLLFIVVVITYCTLYSYCILHFFKIV